VLFRASRSAARSIARVFTPNCRANFARCSGFQASPSAIAMTHAWAKRAGGTLSGAPTRATNSPSPDDGRSCFNTSRKTAPLKAHPAGDRGARARPPGCGARRYHGATVPAGDGTLGFWCEMGGLDPVAVSERCRHRWSLCHATSDESTSVHSWAGTDSLLSLNSSIIG
jgi:hypothetical protein